MGGNFGLLSWVEMNKLFFLLLLVGFALPGFTGSLHHIEHKTYLVDGASLGEGSGGSPKPLLMQSMDECLAVRQKLQIFKESYICIVMAI